MATPENHNAPPAPRINGWWRRNGIKLGLWAGVGLLALGGAGEVIHAATQNSGNTEGDNSGYGGTPTPLVTDTPIPNTPIPATPLPIITMTATPNTPNDHEMIPGECFNAPANSLVQGDVTINGVPLYDTGTNSRGIPSQNTGLIVEMNQGGNVCALWGADVQMGISPNQEAQVLGNDTILMKQNGCGQPNGCQEVDIVKFGN